MILDALDGKIDLIITKTVSRFARNTVDSLTTIRKLKERGVEVYFEEQNIYTLDSKGELLITIMSSFAQEESHSISDNTKWGIRKRYEDGKVSVAYSRFLGYDKGPNGGLIVNPEEAETIRQIYKWFLEGFTPYTIAKKLTAKGVLTPSGQEKWPASTVSSILQNEKYMGDALLQKQYTVDFLTKRRVKNDSGVLPQYYVEGDHEAIIDPDTFDLVQLEIQRRKESRIRYSGVSIFSSKIICGCCGATYGKKVWVPKTKHKKFVYQCNRKYKGDDICPTPALVEEDIKKAFISAVNQLITNRTSIVNSLNLLVADLEDTSAVELKINELDAKMSTLEKRIRDLISENTDMLQEQIAKYDLLVDQFKTAKREHDECEQMLSANRANAKILRKFIADLLEQHELVTDFDDQLWASLVLHVTVYSKDDIRVTFKDGTEIKA